MREEERRVSKGRIPETKETNPTCNDSTKFANFRSKKGFS